LVPGKFEWNVCWNPSDILKCIYLQIYAIISSKLLFCEKSDLIYFKSPYCVRVRDFNNKWCIVVPKCNFGKKKKHWGYAPESIPNSTGGAWGGIFACPWENSNGRRGSLEERGAEYGEILLKYMSMCSTLMEELWRGRLRPMGCWDAWPHQPDRM
jgi:hypothetical protein